VDPNEAIATLELAIDGMTCDACVQRVEAVVGAIAGVEAVDARVGRVRVEYYPQAASREGIEAAIRELGYAVADEPGREGPARGFLADMARTNQALFGNRRLDCCTLNRPPHG
jgi:copper chaperone CopZ